MSRPVTGLRYGNGCQWHRDCFSCPFRDCIRGSATVSDDQKAKKAAAAKRKKEGDKPCESCR